MTEFLIWCLEEYARHGNSFETSALREALQSGGVKGIHILVNCEARQEGYFSITEAALVAMLEIIKAAAHAEHVDLINNATAAIFCSDKEHWVYLVELIPTNDLLGPALLS